MTHAKDAAAAKIQKAPEREATGVWIGLGAPAEQVWTPWWRRWPVRHQCLPRGRGAGARPALILLSLVTIAPFSTFLVGPASATPQDLDALGSGLPLTRMAGTPERPVLILRTLESPLIAPAGSADYLDLRPATASITAGTGQAYTAILYAGKRQLGDYTPKTRFTITPPGSCTGATCTATVAGDHTVTGTIPGTAVSATAALTVLPGPLSRITLDPPSASVAAGTGQAYTVTGYDTYGNQAGNVTARTVLSITPDGSCTRARCMATKAGVHTVTGTVTGTAITAVARLQMILVPAPWWRRFLWLLVAGALLVA